MRHKCLNCGRDLNECNRADNPGARAQMKWCSLECKRTYKNARYYQQHRDEVRARIARNKRKQRAQGVKNETPDAGFDMIDEEPQPCPAKYWRGGRCRATQAQIDQAARESK